ncbi:ABC-F family ATP-binding cassette domain-containing protein [Terrisporobacter petrolearius]|uniref:ABC-F family ATP-binding cassette domain-containing protein n=1 Tax=Terrisporobacter petrolearius TaxID=1460447 RepID=UPI003B00118C
MSILSVDNLTQGFGDKILFNDVSFKLLRGEHIGLVGANGEGKTSFMKLITNELLPDSGIIQWNSKISVGYMDQNVNIDDYESVEEFLKSAFKDLYLIEANITKLYEKMQFAIEDELQKIMYKASNLQGVLEESDFYSIDSKVDAIAYGIGIKEFLLRNPNNLSGGQRSKVLLAKLLLEKPDILLLDEPTNHLDEENIDWLESYLKSYENAFILISHDTEFMNEVVNVIYNLENKKLTRYVGNYEKFLEQHELQKEQLQRDYNKQQNEISKLEDYIRKNKTRAATAAQAKSREKKLKKMSKIEINKIKPKPHFNFKYSKAPWQVLFKTKNLVIGYDKPLTKPLNLQMERDDKIAITGANGIGKTTLLKSLMGIINPIGGKVILDDHVDIGYYEQEVFASDNIVLDEAWNEFPHMNRTDVRKILARCGLTDEHINSEVSVLSGGEQAKVRLCQVINKPSNILFLDEPTNHLDVQAKEELKRALIAYEGSIILVSHDKEFYKDIVNKVWDCEKWRV